MNIRIELNGIGDNIDGMKISLDKGMSIQLPGRVDDSNIKKLTADTEIFHKIVQEHPDKVSSMINNVFQGNMEAARSTAKEIGITEDKFSEKGDGMIMLAVAVGLAILLWPSEAW